MRFGGLPARAWSSQKGNTGDVSLADFVSHIKSLGDGAGNMHWRYFVILKPILLFVLPTCVYYCSIIFCAFLVIF